MLDVKILKLMFKEEFRLHASFFNRSFFPFSSLAIILFTFIMGASLPMLRRVVAIDDMLLVAHWILLFYGLGVGGFAMFIDFSPVEFDFGAAVLADEHAVADLDFERNFLAVIGLARAQRADDTFLWFFLGGIRDNDSALFCFLLFNRF